MAVRLLPPEYARDAEVWGRFLEEARSLVALSHPNITTLFDVGEHDGRVYLVFEYLKGQSLRAEMAGRPMNARRAIELAIQIADAVAGAHAAGFTRGGFSPDLIAITSKDRANISVFEPAAHAGVDRDGPAIGIPTTTHPKRLADSPPTSDPTSTLWARFCTGC